MVEVHSLWKGLCFRPRCQLTIVGNKLRTALRLPPSGLL